MGSGLRAAHDGSRFALFRGTPTLQSMKADSPWGAWGAVPDDGDVRPASRIPPIRNGVDRRNKKHHFVSVTYMNGFLNDAGRVWAYRAEAPENASPTRPEAVGYQNHYYSQTLPDGSVESHRFEDLWNSFETVWEETRGAVADQRVSPAISFNLLGMAALMRVRVPAARERNEVLLAARLRAEALSLESFGALPIELARYSGILDTIPVGINPQATLEAMNADFKAFGDLCFQIGFEVLHNTTDVPFITSDNPVCIHDPTVPTLRRRPYTHGRNVELLFPIDAWTILRGSSRLSPVNHVGRHRIIGDSAAVRRINWTTARYAYRLSIASDRSADAVIARNAAESPTVSTRVVMVGKEIQIIWEHVFGPRPSLSPYIDTPEKAARFEARLTAADDVDGNNGTAGGSDITPRKA